MKTSIELNSELFRKTGVEPRASNLDVRFSFPSAVPAGLASLRFARGMVKEADALVWETIVQSTSGDLPRTPEALADWSSKAHELAHDWFFKLIEGDIRRRFE
jgi:uncharacterized protein (TIGR04255 family)